MNVKQKITISILLILFSVAAFENTNAQTQTTKPAKPTIVIVHGAWGGGWAFRKVDAMLSEKGYNVYRASLTGLGERVHLATPDVGLSTHINDVVNMILFEDLHDIILVGHSYGGMVITGVADRVPERIKRVVYLDAMLPNDGESVVTLLGGRADWVKQMQKDSYIVPPWVKPDQPPPHDVPQPIKTFTETITLKNKAAQKIPGSYILTVDKGREAKDDDFFQQSERAKQRGWQVFQLTSDHNPQWSAPEALVEMLERVAN